MEPILSLPLCRMGRSLIKPITSFPATYTKRIMKFPGRGGIGHRSKQMSRIFTEFGEYLVKPGLVDSEHGRALNEAFHARLDSDYVPYPSPDMQTAEQLVEKAQAFVEYATQFLANGDTGRKENDAK